MWADYEVIGDVGVGSFSKVQKVRRRTDNKILACRVISLYQRHNLKHIEKTYSVLTQLKHPNILSYEDFQQTPEQVKLLMEFCPRGTLQDLVYNNESYSTRVEEDLIWQMTNQLSSALRYCHFGVEPAGKPLTGIWQAILHKNIKPANVFIIQKDQESIVVKLGDFSLSLLQDSTNTPNLFAGTRYYQAPEISRFSSPCWTKACDIYSLGCTIYTVAALSPPRSFHMDEDDMCPELPDFYSKHLRDFVSDCQAFQPENRPDAFDLVWISNSASERTSAPGETSPTHQEAQSSQSGPPTYNYAATLNPEFQTSAPARKDLEVLSRSDVLWSRWTELPVDEQVQSASELLPEFETSLGICEKLFGPKHDKTVEALSRLEELHFRQSETVRAEISQAVAQHSMAS